MVKNTCILGNKMKQSKNLPIPQKKPHTPPTLTDTSRRLAEAFLEGRKDTTKEAYQRDLEELRSYLGLSDLGKLGPFIAQLQPGEANALALQWKAQLKERRLSPATINRRLAAFRSLVKFSKTIGLISWTLEIKNEKVEAYRDTSGINPETFTRLLTEVKRQLNPAKAARDMAILRLLYDLGLRRAEVLGLDREDLDLENGRISILGKGRSEKEQLTLSSQSKAALEAHLAIRGKQPGAIFGDFDHACKGSGRLSHTGLSLLVRNLGRRLGLKLSPHKLRHSAITQACKLAQNNGIGLEEVRDFSRHKDVRTLMVYRDRERNVQGQLASLVGNTCNT